MGKIKVLVISQQSFFRQGVWHSLSQNPELAVATTAELDGVVLAEIKESQPDVAVIDIDGMSPENIQALRSLKVAAVDMGLILLSSDPDDNQYYQALKLQAAACLNKEISPEALIENIRTVSRGERPIQQAFTTRQKVALQVLQKFQELSWKSDISDHSPLTDRETEILQFVAQGYLNKQIALQLGISEQTIKNHVTSILRKLNASARTEAVVLAIKQGLITIS